MSFEALRKKMEAALEMEVKATPGPWSDTDPTNALASVFDVNGAQVAQASQLTPLCENRTQTDRRANAILIATSRNAFRPLLLYVNAIISEIDSCAACGGTGFRERCCGTESWGICVQCFTLRDALNQLEKEWTS